MESNTLYSCLRVIFRGLLPNGFAESQDLDSVVRKFVSLIQNNGKETSLFECVSLINQCAMNSYGRTLINLEPQELSNNMNDEIFLLQPFVKKFSHDVIEVYYQETSTLVWLGMSGSPPFPSGQKMKKLDPFILEPMRDWKSKYEK